ncbi:Ciliary neurotrophic factor receptor subunit alpha, partial [Ophiophagus hannah]
MRSHQLVDCVSRACCGLRPRLRNYWHLPSPTYIPDTFNITVIHDSQEIACEKDTGPKNRCYIRYPHLFSTKKYKVTLTVSNALGSSSTGTSFDEFAIDPPENVIAKPIPNNTRRLLVMWQYPSSWPDPDSFPLKFFLRYRPLIIDQWQHVELSDGTSHIITDAYAGKEYIIQVAAKDNEIGTWSDWSVAVHATPWTEEPKHLTTEAQGAGEGLQSWLRGERVFPGWEEGSRRDRESRMQREQEATSGRNCWWLHDIRRSFLPLKLRMKMGIF